jgi:hypothetical protein
MAELWRKVKGNQSKDEKLVVFDQHEVFRLSME